MRLMSACITKTTPSDSIQNVNNAYSAPCEKCLRFRMSVWMHCVLCSGTLLYRIENVHACDSRTLAQCQSTNAQQMIQTEVGNEYSAFHILLIFSCQSTNAFMS